MQNWDQNLKLHKLLYKNLSLLVSYFSPTRYIKIFQMSTKTKLQHTQKDCMCLHMAQY
jgi:hypothetical protein